MSDTPTFWQRNSGAALLGLAAYLVVTPAFGFQIDDQLTDGHGVTSSEPPSGPEDQVSPTLGDLLEENGLATWQLMAPVSDLVDGVNGTLRSYGLRIEIPDPGDRVNDVEVPEPVLDLLGEQLLIQAPADPIELFGSTIDPAAPGTIDLVGALIDLDDGLSQVPSAPADLVAPVPSGLVPLPAATLPEADLAAGDPAAQAEDLTETIGDLFRF